MIIRKIKSLRYYFSGYLFEYFAIPGTKNEEISKSLLKKYLPNKPVIIDCGAHDGSDSISLAKLFKRGTIHSFEPVDELYARLKGNSNSYKNITCYKLALADRNGNMDFHVSGGGSDASSSLLEPFDHLKDHPDTFFKRKINVVARTLDTWADENNIEKVDMLWLDMQGFELQMLKASEIILNMVSVIHTEVSTRETYKGVPLYDDLRSFLEAKGFSVKIEALPTGWDMGNVLFVKDK